MSHSKRWRDSLPTSFKSPFMAQGDLGFFSAHRKTYGSFFLAVNSYSGYIHVSKISNTKLATLVEAVAKMVKVNKFSCTAMFHHHHHHHHVIIIFFFKKRINILRMSTHCYLTVKPLWQPKKRATW